MLATIHKMTFRLLRTYLFNGCDFLGNLHFRDNNQNHATGYLIMYITRFGGFCLMKLKIC